MAGIGIGYGIGLKESIGGDSPAPEPSVTFDFTVKTDNPGSSSSTSFLLPLAGSGTYNFDIDWGDGNTETITSNLAVTHDYGVAGTYTIKIGGTNNTFPRMFFNAGGDRQKILNVSNWGDIVWQTFDGAFNGCSNMQVSATDADTATVTSFANAFQNCTLLDLDISSWDWTNVGTAADMFTGSSFSTVNYDSFLISISSQTPKGNVLFAAGTACYSTGAAQSSHENLTGALLWTISDGGVCNDIALWEGTVSTSWKLAANWFNNVVPDNTMVATFEFANNKPCNIDENADVKGFHISIGYTSTITQDAGSTITVGSGAWFQTNGTFAGGDSEMDINGGYVQFGGTFTSTSGNLNLFRRWIKFAGTFNHNNGRVNLDKTDGPQALVNFAVEEFYQFQISKSFWATNVLFSKIQVSNRLIIDTTTLTILNRLVGTIELIGTAKLEQNGNIYGLAGNVDFKGASHEWIQANTRQSAHLPNMTIDCTSLTLTQDAPGNVFGVRTLNHDGGSFDVNASELNVDTDMTLIASFADLGGCTLNVDGDFSATGANLKAASEDWILNVGGTNTAVLCDIQHCDASSSTGNLLGTLCTDSGNNTGVTFL